MTLYREQGIVLRTWKLGEADRILSVLTPGRGKIRAVAKGVRRPRSRFGGRLEPFSHVDLQLYEGRNLDIVAQAELITPFAELRDDWVRSACGSAMVEAADHLAQEQERSTRLFLLLLDGLRALVTQPAHPATVLDAYLLRLAGVAGYRPFVTACATCGSSGPHRVFSIADGGSLCSTCAPATAQRLDPAVITFLGVLAVQPWEAVATVTTDGRVRRAAGALVHSFVTYHLGRPLRSWELVPR